MSPELLQMTISLASGLMSLVLGVGLFTAIERLYDFLLRRGLRKASTTIASDNISRLQGLITSMNDGARATDRVLREITADLENRQKTLSELQQKTVALAAEEEAIKTRLSALKEMRIEAAEYFTDTIEKMEKRRYRRDIVIFVAGAVTTTVISILLKHFSLA